MKIAIHDAELDICKDIKSKFPNYALMKISAYHKARGDSVEWFDPIFAEQYDEVYSSKVFESTPDNPYLPPNTKKGGTGYMIYKDLPEEIDEMYPDYSIYPYCDYAIGFLTRGCKNKCPWCIVPIKEGPIRAYRTWRELVRKDTNKLVLMDNNVLACPHGIEQMKDLIGQPYEIDFNQGLDCSLVDDYVADILVKLKWIRFVRFSCDTAGRIKPCTEAIDKLIKRGMKASRISIYTLIEDNVESITERLEALRPYGSLRVYGMPYLDPRKGIYPRKWQNYMANKYIYSGAWRKESWQSWHDRHTDYFGTGDDYVSNKAKRTAMPGGKNEQNI